MKKFTWIVAMLAVLALAVTGCPGGGDPEKKTAKVNLKEVFSATEASQDIMEDGVKKGTVTLTLGENSLSFSGTYAGTVTGKLSAPQDAPFNAGPYSGFKFEYKAVGNWQIIMMNDTSGGDDAGAWIYKHNGSDGWGAIPGSDEWAEFTVNFTSPGFGKAWGEGTAFNKETIYEMMFGLVNDNPAAKKFELRNLQWIADPNYKPGKPSEPPDTPKIPYPVEDKPMTVTFKTDSKSATVKGTGYQTVDNGNLIIAHNGTANEYRAQVNFDSAAQTDLTAGYSKFGMQWTSGSVAGGNFNIRLNFTCDRMLSGYLASGGDGATLNFSDVPEWASGWGDAAVGTITGFEIYSSDGGIGSGNMVITKIWFE
jgi:hypothetical protein